MLRYCYKAPTGYKSPMSTVNLGENSTSFKALIPSLKLRKNLISNFFHCLGWWEARTGRLLRDLSIKIQRHLELGILFTYFTSSYTVLGNNAIRRLY